jgi:hypothetical protein
MDTHKGVEEGTITPNTDGAPPKSKTEKQLEMEGHRDFIQECAIEDEEWKWSPVYLLLRDFCNLSAYLPRPWKHTAEEWHFIDNFFQSKFFWLTQSSTIVVALQSTWRLHFSENITEVNLNALSQRLEHVSQEKAFVSNLYRVQDLMSGQWNYSWTGEPLEEMSETSTKTRQMQVLANDIASFKAPSETPGHQNVMKMVCKNLSELALCGMVKHDDRENFKDMWIRGCPKNKQEMLIKKWKSKFFDSYCRLYDIVTLS